MGPGSRSLRSLVRDDVDVASEFVDSTGQTTISNMTPISRRDSPEVCKSYFASLRIEGAGNAGRSMRPQPRMQNKTKHTSIVTTVTPEITRHSPRNGFTAYFALSPVTTLV